MGGFNLKRFLAILAVLLFAQSVLAAVTVYPNSISVQLAPNDSINQKISIMSIDSNESNYIVSWEGETTDVSVFWDTGFFNFTQIGTTKELQLTIQSKDDPGSFSGTVILKKLDSIEVFNIPVTIDVIKWLSEDTVWMKEDEMLLINDKYKLVVTSVSNYVVYDLFKDDSKILSQSRVSAEGKIEQSDLLLTILEIDSGTRETKIKIESIVSNQTWAIEKREDEYGVGKLEPTISKYIMTLEQGKSIEMQIGIRNEFNEAVDLQDVLLFPIGSSLFAIKEAQLQNLPPNEKMSVIVKIDSTGVETGNYTSTLTIVGYYKQQKVTAEISLDLVITPGATPETGDKSSVVCNIPDKGISNLPFEITVEGIKESDTVNLAQQPNLLLKSQTFSDEKEKISLAFSSTGTVTVALTISRAGSVLKECSKTVSIEQYSFEIFLSQEEFKEGDEVEIFLEDSNGETLTGKILVDDEKYDGGFKAEVGTRTIEATVFGVTQELVFEVEPKNVYAPNQYYTILPNEKLSINLSESTDWEVRDPEGNTIGDGEGKEILFTTGLTGRFMLYNVSDGETLLSTIDVAPQGIPIEFILFSISTILIAVVLVKFFPNQLKKLLKRKGTEKEETKFLEEDPPY